LFRLGNDRINPLLPPVAASIMRDEKLTEKVSAAQN
jgi:hypothetical protein